MTDCPHCGEKLPAEAKFCTGCGESLELRCRNCGETVPADANFCPSCKEQIGGGGSGQAQQRHAKDGPLRLKPREFAYRLEREELGKNGVRAWINRRKEVEIEEGNRALFLKNGKLVETLGPGRHQLETLGQRITNFLDNWGRKNNLTIILVEESGTAVDIVVEDIRTATEYLVTVSIELVFDVDDYELFVQSMLSDRNTVTAETFDSLLRSMVRDELQATISNYERDELYGNRELKQELQGDIERHCRSALENNGLRLVELRSFDYEDDRDDIREGKKYVENRKEKEDIRDEEAKLDRRGRERETDDVVHQEGEKVRKETAKQAADHEIESQQIDHEHEKKDKERRHGYQEEREDIEHEHTKDDMERRHQHEAEREEMEHDYDRMDHERDRTDHDEQVKTRKKEGHVERRDLEHEQDTKEMEDLMDLKKKKDMDGLDVDEREQEMEMRREEHAAEVERERLNARDDVDLDTVASLEDADDDVTELAKMDKAENLSAEQLDSLGAQQSDELAEARKEANKAEHERRRLEDQKEFREEVKEMADDSMDRMQETTESAMDNMGETGKAAAEDTSDNVIVSDSGSSDSGDTTIVQGGSGGSSGESASREPHDDPKRSAGPDHGGGQDRGRGGASDGFSCPECGEELEPNDDFCMYCGSDI
jgi:hypothetical protein